MLDHALALAAKGFWVFPIRPDGKKPAHTGWQEEATRDPETIKKLWSSHAYNVGISTSRYENNKSLLAVDVDNKEGKHGDAELLRLELDGRDFPSTYTQCTPTGGRHLVYVVDHPVKQGANVLAPGLDTRGRGGYIVGAGSLLDGRPYTGDDHPVSPAPQWLVDFCGRAPDRKASAPLDLSGVDQRRARDRAVAFLEGDARVSVQGDGGDQTAFTVACRVKDYGVPADDCLALMLEHWNDRCDPPWDADDLGEKVRNAYAYGIDPPGVAAPETIFPPLDGEATTAAAVHPFEELNREYAFVTLGGSGAILHETTDADGAFQVRYLEVPTFHTKLAARKMRIETKTGTQEVPITKLWLQDPRRRTFNGVVFRPGLPTPDGYYNVWRGFTVEPKPGGHPALDLFLDHARHNVCCGDDKLFRWLMGYFAQMIQRPWDKPLTALVFQGSKGTGKNALVERVGYLLGSHFAVADDDRYLLSNFNGHMERMLFMVLDEAAWAGDKRAEGKLKGIITGSHHLVEQKGREPYRVENRTRIAIIGNEDWLVPASHDERRFAVFKMGEDRKQDRAYFESMRRGMESGGYQHLLHYLLHYDLTGIDVNGAPVTKALLAQKHASLGPFEEYWLECLTEERILESDFGSGWPQTVECDRLRSSFERYLRRRNIRSRGPNANSIGRQLSRMRGVVTKDRGPKSEGQPWRYVLPELPAARIGWERYIGHPVEWS